MNNRTEEPQTGAGKAPEAGSYPAQLQYGAETQKRERPVIPWQKETPVAAPYPAGRPPTLPPAGWRPGYQLETQTLGYHRLSYADPVSAWWKPLVEGLLGVVFYLVLSLVFGLALILASMVGVDPSLAGGVFSFTDLSELQTLALRSPLVFTLVFGSVALMFPSLWLARLITGPKPWGLVHSVAGKMRWGWLASCLAAATALVVGVPLGIDALAGSQLAVNLVPSPEALLPLLVAVALVVPFQAYAEELIFRGYLMQTIGRWLKHPAWAIVLPAPLFMLGHAYDLWAQLSILVMGLAAGYITWRTGGLEAAIALHVVNNLLAMSFGIFGLADPFVQQGSSPASLVGAVISNGLYVLLVIWLAKKGKVVRSRPAQVYVKAKP